MKGNVWQVAVVALCLAVVLPALNIGFGNAAQQFAVANEPATVDYGSDTTVDEEAYEYNETITATVNDNGDELEQGTDYLWNVSAGTIDWQNTAATADGDDVQLAYDYRRHEQTAKNIERALAPIAPALGLLLLITVVGLLLAWHAIGSSGGSF
jgi:hypothetical protein